MKIERPPRQKTFTLSDLGVLSGRTDPVFARIARLAEKLMPLSVSALILSDLEARRALVRAHGPAALTAGLPARFLLRGSLTERVCLTTETISSAPGEEANWSKEMPEISRCGARGFVAAPVRGPADEVVGILGCFSAHPLLRTDDTIESVETLARLASERIMLKAALRTVELMAEQRMALSDCGPIRCH